MFGFLIFLVDLYLFSTSVFSSICMSNFRSTLVFVL